MRYRKLLILVLMCLATSSPVDFAQAQEKSWPIITRKGDQLFEDDRPFRFFGLAAPNIQQNESQLRIDFSNRFPDEFEIRDCMSALSQLGSRATRTFSLSVYSPKDNGVPTYITGRRTYNEEAFRCLDRVIALSHEYDVRLIIPFIASQSFGGIRGVDEFAALSGKSGGEFWTDPQVKEDFKHFLSFILNRKNTINGIVYKDDPAILCWQLGNEFGSYCGDRKLDCEKWKSHILKWSLEMSAYIKQQDPNHLIMEAGGADREEFIRAPNIDLISDHLYEYWSKISGRPYDLSAQAIESLEQCKGRKPLVVDEFGLGTIENQVNLMRTIREHNIVGGLMWSIRSHRRDGGWYYHNEGGTPVNSFHYPGFASGFAYDEQRLLEVLRREAYSIRGIAMPAAPIPSPVPVLFATPTGLTWRGSTGAAYYILERAPTEKGPWSVLATGLHDSVIADVVNFEYSPQASEPVTLYHDESREVGKTSYYRIKAANSSGSTSYSPVLEIKAGR